MGVRVGGRERGGGRGSMGDARGERVSHGAAETRIGEEARHPMETPTASLPPLSPARVHACAARPPPSSSSPALSPALSLSAARRPLPPPPRVCRRASSRPRAPSLLSPRSGARRGAKGPRSSLTGTIAYKAPEA